MLLKSFIILQVLAQLSSCVDISNNGYSNIVIGISESVPQPPDGGTSIINSIQSLVTDASKALFKATRYRAYFRDVDILVPTSWTFVPGAELTNSTFYESSPIKIVSEGSVGQGNIPFTQHSGKCGVPGKHIEIPIAYLGQTTETSTAKAKAMVHEWAKFRYGVFEEHGYPADQLLPYFYLHPGGYHAVTSCNSTYLSGTIQHQDGSYCDVNQGLISEPDSCRFVPYITNQDAKSSLMSYHFVDSVDSFCDDSNHDRLARNRQNQLCGGKSVWSVISSSKDFANNANPPAAPDTTTTPNVRVLQRKAKLPAIYVVVDVAYPTNPNSKPDTLRGALRTLVANLNGDLRIGFAVFKGSDTGSGSYLSEILPPVIIKDNQNAINSTIEQIRTASNAYTRDTGAAVRDSLLKLKTYGFDNTGGAILYLVTYTRSMSNVRELLMVQQVLSSNVKLVAAETGDPSQGKSLERFASLVDGAYFYTPEYGTNLFPQIQQTLLQLSMSPVSLRRTELVTTQIALAPGSNHQGSFQLYEAFGKDTDICLQNALEDVVTVTLQDPTGGQHVFSTQTNETNWNILNAVPLVTRYTVDQAQSGTWSYSLSCQGTCRETAVFQVTSGYTTTSKKVVPRVTVWTTETTPGNVDLASSPLIIYVEVSTEGGRTVNLDVVAAITRKDTGVLQTISLTDTGIADTDISRDGVYSGIYYPSADGIYYLSVYISSKNGARQESRLLPADQGSICCGSQSASATINNFEVSLSAVLSLFVRNSASIPVKPTQITDVVVKDEFVYYDLLKVTLTWTAPYNSLTQPNQPVGSYKIRYSESIDDLINNFESAGIVTVIEGSTPVTPGSLQEVTGSVPYNGKIIYIAVKSISSSQVESDMSPVRWTTPNPPEFTTQMSTDLTTAATSPSTISSTTDGTTTSVTETTTQTVTTTHAATTETTRSSSITTGLSTASETPTSITATTSISTTSGSSITSTASVSSTATSERTTTTFSSSTVTSESSTATTPSTTGTVESTTTTGSSSSVSTGSTDTSLQTTATTGSSSSGTTESTTASISSTGTVSSSTASVSTSSTGDATTLSTGSTTTSPSGYSSTTVTTESTTSTTTSSLETTSSTGTLSSSTITSSPEVTTTPPPPVYQTPEFIGGVAAGATALVIIIGVAIYCLCKKKKKKNEISYEPNVQSSLSQPPKTTPEKPKDAVLDSGKAKPEEHTKKTELNAKESVVTKPVVETKVEITPQNDWDLETYEDDDGLITTAL